MCSSGGYDVYKPRGRPVNYSYRTFTAHISLVDAFELFILRDPYVSPKSVAARSTYRGAASLFACAAIYRTVDGEGRQRGHHLVPYRQL